MRFVQRHQIGGVGSSNSQRVQVQLVPFRYIILFLFLTKGTSLSLACTFYFNFIVLINLLKEQACSILACSFSIFLSSPFLPKGTSFLPLRLVPLAYLSIFIIPLKVQATTHHHWLVPFSFYLKN